MANSPSELPAAPHDVVPPRRSFLTQAAAIVIGGLAGLAPLAAGVVFFLDPIFRRGKSSGSDGFLRAANVSELPADGTPERFTLRADVHDAWTLYRNRVLGSVYLRLMPNGQVIAFNDTCTHLGCKVDYQASQKQFFCPCHQSAFDLEGKTKNKTPPRDMDELLIEIRDGEVFVKYQNFRTATPEKKAISG